MIGPLVAIVVVGAALAPVIPNPAGGGGVSIARAALAASFEVGRHVRAAVGDALGLGMGPAGPDRDPLNGRRP